MDSLLWADAGMSTDSHLHEQALSSRVNESASLIPLSPKHTNTMLQCSYLLPSSVVQHCCSLRSLRSQHGATALQCNDTFAGDVLDSRCFQWKSPQTFYNAEVIEDITELITRTMCCRVWVSFSNKIYCHSPSSASLETHLLTFPMTFYLTHSKSKT